MACMASPFAWIVATVLLIGLYFYVMKDMKKRSCACKIEKQGLQSKRKKFNRISVSDSFIKGILLKEIYILRYKMENICYNEARFRH